MSSHIPKIERFSRFVKHDDKLLKDWCNQKQKLVQKLQGKLCKKKRHKFRKMKQLLIRRIRKRVKFLDDQKVSQLASKLESNIGNRRYFEAVRSLREDKRYPFTLQDQGSRYIYQDRDKCQLLIDHYNRY